MKKLTSFLCLFLWKQQGYGVLGHKFNYIVGLCSYFYMKGLIFLKKLPFMGSGVAIVTPFNEDNEVNYDIFEELIEKNQYIHWKYQKYNL